MAKLGNLSPIFSEIYVERPDGTKVFKAYLAGEWVGSESLTEVRSPIDLETYAYVPRSVIVRGPHNYSLGIIGPHVGLNEEICRSLSYTVRGRRVKRGILVTALLAVNLIGGKCERT
jgi:hypothetical protein